MIARLLRLALHQRLVSILIGVLLVGLGVWAFSQLSIEAYPDISDTQVVVVTQYPGHAAEEIEQQVSVPVERALNSVPGVIARRSRTPRSLRPRARTQASSRLTRYDMPGSNSPTGQYSRTR